MPKVNYYLKNAPSVKYLENLKKAKDKAYAQKMNERFPIVVSIAYDGKRELIATGKFVLLKLWDREAQRIKTLIETPETSKADGEWLDAKKLELERYLRSAHDEFTPITKNDIYQILCGKVKSSKECINLSDVLEVFFKEHSTAIGASLKSNTKKIYITLIKHIEAFQGGKTFKSDIYTTKWIKDFKEHLTHIVMLNDNSVCKYIKALKSFFRVLRKCGYNVKAHLDEVKLSERGQLVIALKEEEFRKLERWIPKTEFQRKVLDIFLFQCYTGARHSDVHKIKREQIRIDAEGRLIWEYISIKTDENISVMLNSKAVAIIERYKELTTPLPQISNQVINRELKIIAKELGLDRMVKKVTYYDNRKHEEYYELHSLLSTHIARKTFISLMLQMNVDERSVRAITGHKDERSFRRYIDLDKKPLYAIDGAWNKIMSA